VCRRNDRSKSRTISRLDVPGPWGLSIDHSCTETKQGRIYVSWKSKTFIWLSGLYNSVSRAGNVFAIAIQGSPSRRFPRKTTPFSRAAALNAGEWQNRLATESPVYHRVSRGLRAAVLKLASYVKMFTPRFTDGRRLM
jgi:hypothetical protein